ncbi:MAG: hypothetical protein IAE67_09180 [Candidatus Competibacteraceae bacterium]|nr:hypothetical protein [Candidatus Competibacteraceae bacterium]
MNKKRIIRGFLFYMLGLAIGTLGVYFLWLRNRPDLLSWWPGGRVKDKLLRSEWVYDDTYHCYRQCYALSDEILHQMIRDGKVRFGISKPRRSPCPIYVIDTRANHSPPLRLHVELCDSLATLYSIENLPGEHQPAQCSCVDKSY